MNLDPFGSVLWQSIPPARRHDMAYGMLLGFERALTLLSEIELPDDAEIVSPFMAMLDRAGDEMRFIRSVYDETEADMHATYGDA